MSKKKKELTDEELEETAGGRRIRRVDSDAAPRRSDPIEVGEEPEPGPTPTIKSVTRLPDPEFGAP